LIFRSIFFPQRKESNLNRMNSRAVARRAAAMGRYAMRLNPLARAVRSKLHWAAIAFLLNTSSPYHPIVFP